MVERNFKRIVKHARDKLLQQRRRLFQTWVSVDLDEPRFQISVDHEVIAQNLKAEASVVLIELEP